MDQISMLFKKNMRGTEFLKRRCGLNHYFNTHKIKKIEHGSGRTRTFNQIGCKVVLGQIKLENHCKFRDSCVNFDKKINCQKIIFINQLKFEVDK